MDTTPTEPPTADGLPFRYFTCDCKPPAIWRFGADERGHYKKGNEWHMGAPFQTLQYFTENNRHFFEVSEDGTPLPAEAGPKCIDCGTSLNAGEAAVFTVCDACWEKHHGFKRMKVDPQPAPREWDVWHKEDTMLSVGQLSEKVATERGWERIRVREIQPAPNQAHP